jgi:hypothetical protein
VKNFKTIFMLLLACILTTGAGCSHLKNFIDHYDPQIATVEVIPNMLNFETAGSTANVHAVVIPSNDNQDVRWYSTDTTIASISGHIVTAIGKGKALIIAESIKDSEKVGICQVKVAFNADIKGTITQIYSYTDDEYFVIIKGEKDANYKYEYLSALIKSDTKAFRDITKKKISYKELKPGQEVEIILKQNNPHQHPPHILERSSSLSISPYYNDVKTISILNPKIIPPQPVSIQGYGVLESLVGIEPLSTLRVSITAGKIYYTFPSASLPEKYKIEGLSVSFKGQTDYGRSIVAGKNWFLPTIPISIEKVTHSYLTSYPMGLSPKTGDTLNQNNPKLTWISNQSNRKSYEVVVSHSKWFSSVKMKFLTGNSEVNLSTVIDDFNKNIAYYWRVRESVKIDGKTLTGPWSPTIKFRISE